MLRRLRSFASAGLAVLVGLVVMVAVLLLPPSAARAEVDSPLVRAGVAAYEALDYPRAISLLRRARKERLTVEELTVTLRTLGSAEVALGDEDAARADFEALVRLAPALTMDRATSPRIRLVFEEARAQVLAGQAEVPEAPEAPRAEPGAAPAPAIRVEGAAAAPPPPPPAVSALALPVEPARPAAQAPAVPAYRKPWFWGVVGGILVAGAAAIVAVALLGRSSDGRLIVVPR